MINNIFQKRMIIIHKVERKICNVPIIGNGQIWNVPKNGMVKLIN